MEVAFFVRQMAVMFNAGIDLHTALLALQRGSAHPALAQVAEALTRQLGAGRPLSSAVRDYPEIFPPIYSAILRVGEESGAFGQCLLRLAAWQEQQAQTLRRLRSSLTYPGVILILTLVLSLLLLGWVLPVLIAILPGPPQPQALLTRVLVSLSGLVQNRVFWIVVLAFGVQLYLGLRQLQSNPEGRQKVAGWAVRLPAIGPVLRLYAVSRFCGCLATMLSTGCPLLRSLNLAGEATGNPDLRREIAVVIREIKQGELLSDCLRSRSQYFPAIVPEMLACAEESGPMHKMLDYLDRALGEEVNYRLETLVALLEPVLLLFVSGIVLTVILGVFVPLYQSLGSVQV